MRTQVRRIVALVLVLVGASPALGGGAQAEGSSDPVVIVDITNEGFPVTLEIVVIDLVDGREVARDSVQVPAFAHVSWDVAADERVYGVEVSLQPSIAAGATGIDMRGCRGPGAVSVLVNDGGVLGFRIQSGSCLVPRVPSSVHMTLRTEALAALQDKGGPSIAVPVPRDADTGTYSVVDLSYDTYTDPVDRPFQWAPRHEFLDAWGRPAEGPRLEFEGSEFGGSYSSTLGGSDSYLQDVARVAAYARGESLPFGETMFFFGMSRADVLGGTVAGGSGFNYDPARQGEICLARNALQGAMISAGDRFAATDFCVTGLDAPGARWFAGRPVAHRGFDAIPLYLVHEDADASTVARAFLSEDHAYPLTVDVARADRYGTFGESYLLERLAVAGEPLAGRPDERAPPVLPLAPIDPVRGPVLRDRSLFALPLDEAADAALAHPAMVAAKLTGGKPVLAGALYDVERTGGVAVAEWVLAYAFADRDAILLSCARAGSAPSAACTQAMAPDPDFFLVADPPNLRPDDVPRRGATFDQAAGRWAAADPDAGQEMTWALYKVWPQRERSTPEWPALIGVGKGVPGAELPAAGAMLDLESGRTANHFTVVARSQILGGIPLAPREAPEKEASPTLVVQGGFPIVATAAAGILALLVALVAKFAIAPLYTRLKRPGVLANATRRPIYDLIDAEPGLHASEIARRLDLSERRAEHHLRVLCDHGLVMAVKRPHRTHYFAAGRLPAHDMKQVMVLRQGQAEKVYRLVLARPGIRLSALAAEAGVSLAYASKLVQRLADHGLVSRVREDRSVALYPAARS